MRRLAAALAAFASLLVAVPAAHALPVSFFGVMADGPLISPTSNLTRELGTMHASHVGSIRLAVYWSKLQPYASAADVPAASRSHYVDVQGVPTNFSETDRMVLNAAKHGIAVLPVVVRSPRWAAKYPRKVFSPPKSPDAYGRFMTALIGRYGPNGSLWAEHPDVVPVPIRQWQVWNEPDIAKYWTDDDWAPGYVGLLRAARTAIKAADPDAQVVAAGLTNRSWDDLDSVYAAGGGPLFDVAAIHPFSRRVDNVVKIVKLTRGVMAKHGDAGKPLVLSEVSWSSGQGRSKFNYGWETSEKGQAERVRSILTRFASLAGAYHLTGVYWYTWLSPKLGGKDSFDYSGLRRVAGRGKVVSKPALKAWTNTVGRLLG